MPLLPSGAIASIGLVQNPDFRVMGQFMSAWFVFILNIIFNDYDYGYTDMYMNFVVFIHTKRIVCTCLIIFFFFL